MQYQLKHPIVTADGKSVSAVTIRELIGRDVVKIGDDVSTLMKYYSDNSPAIIAAAEYAAALGSGEKMEAPAVRITPPGTAEYKAMVAIAGALAGLGDDALNLHVEDLTGIAVQALASGN